METLMSIPTDEEKRSAKLHATVWENAFNVATENAGRRTDIDQGTMKTLGVFALIMAGEYRKIANGREIAD
jgi:hypothetical protein